MSLPSYARPTSSSLSKRSAKYGNPGARGSAIWKTRLANTSLRAETTEQERADVDVFFDAVEHQAEDGDIKWDAKVDAVIAKWSRAAGGQEDYKYLENSHACHDSCAFTMATVDEAMHTRDCTTCDRTLAIAAFPKHPKGSKCTHERDTCRRCWHQWLQNQVATQAVDQISCATCSNLLGQGDIRALATEAVYQKYLDAEFKATLSSDPNFVWCPAGGCKSGQIHEDGNIFRCIQCGMKSCSDCSVLFHEDETCDEFQTRVKATTQHELDSARRLEKYAKICPGPGCGRRVEKNGYVTAIGKALLSGLHYRTMLTNSLRIVGATT